LEAGRFANVRVLEGSLDAHRFYEEFLACDAVLMPYDAERYRTRNSGVFADAVAAGISVIATRGTWMHEQLGRGFGAGLTIPDGDATALANAIVEMAQRRDQMTKKARTAAANWRQLHDPVGFVGALANLFCLKTVTAGTV
jgi:glycosyltransferase involved in cell wall biosynthesis